MGVDQIDCCRRPVTNAGKNFNSNVNNPLFKEAFGDDDDFDNDDIEKKYFEPDEKFKVPSAFPPKPISSKNNNLSKQNNLKQNNLRKNKFENQFIDPFASDNYNSGRLKKSQSANKYDNGYPNMPQNTFSNYPKMPNIPYMNRSKQTTLQNQYLNNIQQTNKYIPQIQYIQQPKIQTSNNILYSQPKIQYPIQNLTTTTPNIPKSTISNIQYTTGQKIQTLPQNIITSNIPTVQYTIPKKQNIQTIIPNNHIISSNVNYVKQPKIQPVQISQITQPQNILSNYNSLQYVEPQIQTTIKTQTPQTEIISNNINYLEPQTQTQTYQITQPQNNNIITDINYLQPQTITNSNNINYLEPQTTISSNNINYLEQPQIQSVQVSPIQTIQPQTTI